jgi:cytochrome P450 family 93 subfamily A
LAAGTSTTALTIEWALAELINHPDILEKLVAEIDTVVGEDRLVDEADIPQLPYLQAVIKETLRLHPTGPLIARRCTEACTVDSYSVPAGMTVFINVWALGRDPESWTTPLDFYPERFLNEDEADSVDVRGQHYQMLPFGTGRRMCPGATLGMLVVQSTLAAMVQCFGWKLSGGGMVDMAEGPGMTLTRAKPLVCMPVPRVDRLLSSLEFLHEKNNE